MTDDAVVSRPARRPARRPRNRAARTNWASLAIVCAAAVGVVQFYHPPRSLLVAPVRAVLAAEPGPDAFGRSGEVKIRFAMPGDRVEYPLEIDGDPTAIRYQWVDLANGAHVDSARPLDGAELVVPSRAGFYRLALLQSGAEHTVSGLTVGVMVPFADKVGATLNGYRIGTYLTERFGGGRPHPEGFLEVQPNEASLQLTRHLRLGDFITHDQHDVWPKYVALSPRILDKLELVVGEVARLRGDSARVAMDLDVDVHSGFRTPWHNGQVKRSARDSQHQYGDAADIAIDANGDGRITAADGRIVALAVDAVEREFPDLVGGMGLYTSRRYRTPYVHIDARGHRARWRG